MSEVTDYWKPLVNQRDEQIGQLSATIHDLRRQLADAEARAWPVLPDGWIVGSLRVIPETALQYYEKGVQAGWYRADVLNDKIGTYGLCHTATGPTPAAAITAALEMIEGEG